MKKIFFLFATVLTLSTLSAQTKITKAAVVGKWALTSVEIPGMLWYDIGKDSLAFGETLKGQIDSTQLSMLTGMMKTQISPFTKMGFIFNADGTAELGTGADISKKVTYRVDEENSTITTIDADKNEETLTAEIFNGSLRFTIKQQQQEIKLVLRKAQ